MLKNKKHIILLLPVCFFLLSCHIKPKGVLSDKKMENILFEMHKSEAVLQVGGFNDALGTQKKESYNQILKKNNASQAEFDSTLAWYTKHPIEFNELYKKVLVRFDTLNAKVARGEFRSNKPGAGMEEFDLWNLRRTYKLTKDSSRTKIDFEITNRDNLLVGDRYVLSFLRRVAKSDSSASPYVVLKINYINGKKDSIIVKTYNDNLQRRIKIFFNAKDSASIKSLSGSLLAYKTAKGKMNAEIDSIKLMRQFNIYNQSKIRSRLLLIEKAAMKKRR